MIDLYAAGTSNGMRAKIMLEECGVPYKLHPIDLMKGEQKTPEFLARNPFGQIPVMVDSDGPGGKPLADQLGGWLKAGAVFKRKEMACYHKEWAYFSARFQVTCAAYIEAKPGIPPTPGHVEEVISLMRSRKIPVLFASNYFPKSQIDQVAAKTGATAVVVPENTYGAPGVSTYLDLVNTWVTGLAAGFERTR